MLYFTPIEFTILSFSLELNLLFYLSVYGLAYLLLYLTFQ